MTDQNEMTVKKAKSLLIRCSMCVDGRSFACSNGNCLIAGSFLEGHRLGKKELDATYKAGLFYHNLWAQERSYPVKPDERNFQWKIGEFLNPGSGEKGK